MMKERRLEVLDEIIRDLKVVNATDVAELKKTSCCGRTYERASDKTAGL